MSETSDCLLCSCLCVKKLIKNTTSETFMCETLLLEYAEACCARWRSINTDVKSEDTEITDTKNHRHTKVCSRGLNLHREKRS